MQNITKAMLEVVENDIHGLVQEELAELRACVPSTEERKKYFKKNVGAYYKAFNETVSTEQKIKTGGYGNTTSKSLTINMNGLSLNDKQKLLTQMTKEMVVLGEKMGYADKGVGEVVEVPPIDKGVNRIKDTGI